MQFLSIYPIFVLITAILGLLFAAYKFFWVKSLPEGNEQMSNIATKIRTINGVSAAVVRVVDSKYTQIEITVGSADTTRVRTDIFFMMASLGCPIIELRSLDPTLEEVFLSITSGKAKG